MAALALTAGCWLLVAGGWLPAWSRLAGLLMLTTDRMSTCPPSPSQVEEGLNHLPVVPKTVQTPTGAHYDGVGFEGRICGVSILRSGEVGVLPLHSAPFTVMVEAGTVWCGTHANVGWRHRQWNKA